jgi:purine-binding chemotaxis protein CheW
MHALADNATALAKTAHLAGKYLTFELGQESYGIPVLKVREIISLMPITPVPQMPEYVQGVINLRGKVIPVIDLRLKFSLSDTELTESSCIVVVQITGVAGGPAKQIGLIVDAVEEVANVAASDIERAPDFGSIVDTSYMLGMAKSKAGVKTLLDIDQVLATDTVQQLPG